MDAEECGQLQCTLGLVYTAEGTAVSEVVVHCSPFSLDSAGCVAACSRELRNWFLGHQESAIFVHIYEDFVGVLLLNTLL